MKTIILNPAEIGELLKPISGEGGFQSLIRNLQAKLDKASGSITLSNEDRERIKRYAFDYGNGGWEARLLNIFQRQLGPDLDA